MIRTEVRTGFEWMDTSFLITRFLCTGWGVLMLVLLLSATFEAGAYGWRQLRPPPTPSTDSFGGEGEAEVHCRTSCFAERSPFLGLALLSWFSGLPVAGMILVWQKPRIGFVFAAGGWFLIGLLPMLDLLRPERSFDWWILVYWQLPVFWLGFASYRVRSAEPRPTDPAIYVYETDTDFEWMDSVVSWMIAPFAILRRCWK